MPDGNLWFSEGTQIGRITPAGTITEFSDCRATAYAGGPLTVGPDGNLWFAETTGFESGGIGRITPAGTITLYPLPVPGISEPVLTRRPGRQPLVRHSAPGQASSSYCPGPIGRITPGGAITEFPLPAGAIPRASSDSPSGPTATSGLVRPSDQTGDHLRRIDRISRRALFTQFPLPRGTTPGEPLTAGPGGTLWFSESSKIGRITLKGGVKSLSLTKLPRHTDAMLDDGRPRRQPLLPGNRLPGRRKGPRSGRRQDRPDHTQRHHHPAPETLGNNLPGSPGPLAVGSDGNLWFYETGTSPSIDRVSLSSDAIGIVIWLLVRILPYDSPFTLLLNS